MVRLLGAGSQRNGTTIVPSTGATDGTCDVAASPLQEAGQPRLVQQVAGVVAGGAVHAEAHVDAVVQSKPHLPGINSPCPSRRDPRQHAGMASSKR